MFIDRVAGYFAYQLKSQLWLASRTRKTVSCFLSCFKDGVGIGNVSRKKKQYQKTGDHARFLLCWKWQLNGLGLSCANAFGLHILFDIWDLDTESGHTRNETRTNIDWMCFFQMMQDYFCYSFLHAICFLLIRRFPITPIIRMMELCETIHRKKNISGLAV